MTEHRLKRLLIVANKYPIGDRVIGHPFVKAFAEEVARQGVQVTVVAPEPLISVSERLVNLKARYYRVNENLEVYVPSFMTFGAKRFGAGFNTVQLTTESFRRSVLNTVTGMKNRKFDFSYGHFFYSSGYTAARMGKHLGVPSVVGFGESMHDVEEVIPMPLHRRERDIKLFSGCLCVSQTIKDYYVGKYGLNPDMLRVFPNAVNAKKFYPRDKIEMRRKLNLPADAFIVAFVGHFQHRKGDQRLMEALMMAPDAKVIFMGRGAIPPSGPQVLHAGPVEHHEMPEYLSAADVFCLPTLSEGSSNAVQEALACGLPVISSNLPFNTEVIDDTMGYLVDPMDVDAIALSIRTLYRDRALLGKKRDAALAFAAEHNLERRASRILSWFEEIIAKN